ncbi:MAG: SDR family NAD(P)-dependent oxidoreductase [Chloroflexaceae bacterium]|nr:SDR family NAD(P)-dependent oxidoreductase [Chloroflexaceae bacterium]
MTTPSTNRVVWINGATGGLGPAVVQAFANEGAHLILSARRHEQLKTIAAHIGLERSRTLLLPLDATSTESIEHAMAQVLAQRTTIDVLVQVTGGFL